jgi:uncharacterized protein YndB with AHSA1/START domain
MSEEPRKFEIRKEVELKASPEVVWDAIATGPGISSWFMGPHEVEPGEHGKVRAKIGDFTSEATVTAWDPPHRFAYHSGEDGEDGFHAFEYLVEGREGGSAVLRFVHSGFLSADWGTEFDEMTGFGWDMYLHTLGQYVRYFTGQTATYVLAEAPPASASEEGWRTLMKALGLDWPVEQDAPVRLTPEGMDPIEGVADWVAPMFLGVRSPDALYRFHGRHLMGMPAAVGHHLFAPGVNGEEAAKVWADWFQRVYA